MNKTKPSWPADYRRLRVGEIMQEGDVIPDAFGLCDPIRGGMLDHPVQGRRNGEDFVYRPRKIHKPARKS